MSKIQGKLIQSIYLQDTCICCLRCRVALNVLQCTSSYITQKCQYVFRLSSLWCLPVPALWHHNRLCHLYRPGSPLCCLPASELQACWAACWSTNSSRLHVSSHLTPQPHVLLWFTVIFTMAKYVNWELGDIKKEIQIIEGICKLSIYVHFKLFGRTTERRICFNKKLPSNLEK